MCYNIITKGKGKSQTPERVLIMNIKNGILTRRTTLKYLDHGCIFTPEKNLERFKAEYGGTTFMLVDDGETANTKVLCLANNILFPYIEEREPRTDTDFYNELLVYEYPSAALILDTTSSLFSSIQ